MPLAKDKAWFPVKTYGWGWGIPCRWQGWVALIGFVAALAAGAPIAKNSVVGFVGYTLLLATILTAICYWKGEKPGWHWGDRE
jgi:hypothetical protein